MSEDVYKASNWSNSQAVSTIPTLEGSLEIETRNPYQDFVRCSKWSPDGSVVLAQSEYRAFQLFYPKSEERRSCDGSSRQIKPIRVLQQAAPILDFLWYPAASPQDPASFCFLASIRECPVKLLDALDGRLRASYKIVDHRERQIAPHSLAFNSTAQKIYCGFEDAIEIFDIARPGEGTRLLTSPSKKSKDGLKGIISSLAFSPTYESDAFYAAGSLSSIDYNIALFGEFQGQVPLMFIGGGPLAGVNQIQFDRMRPHLMYASYRRHGAIYCWDVRSDVGSPLRIFRCLSDPKTNQRTKFDIDISGNLLATGEQDGTISIFDLRNEEQERPTIPPEFEYPLQSFKAHDDAVGSVAFHPLRPTLLSNSGSRHFQPESSNNTGSSEESEESDEDSTDSSMIEDDIPRQARTSKRCHYPIAFDSSIKLWNWG